ncbi:Vps54-like protein-domain-containing protein [Lasiosphaeria miniovina]|uniref:Vps54-like protein-domain-containing protein n=1 Tax=Lasiosphaeria miniovina TaxID=1954250 RepID=A0AA40EA36_9PEZI|nr:Vps54-like protein-domain-containing protein [Lasiosphaeria miniovina]KAK0727923.1 Vps54-like protein-domain-containing protein [Lasiosphaeria miniovina]
MFSNSGARKSVDSLSPTRSIGSRGDFPFHGKGLNPQSPQRHHQRRGSTASSIHSVGGSLDSSSASWAGAVLETGQNAISTLLQPPIVRTGLLPHTAAPASSAHKPPTSRDIPPVTLTNIPHVDSSEFKSYLSQVGALYEQLRRVQADDEDSAAIFSRRNKPDDASDTLADDGHLRPGRRPAATPRRTSTASITSLSPIEPPSPVRRGSSGFRRGASHGPPPLSTIPPVYFDDDFHLENPRTFDVVSERSEVVRPAPGTDDKTTSNGNAGAPRKALATNAILQEKLSWYMDTIEMHLIQSISTASTTFFTALGSLRELHSEAADSVERIRALRRELEALDVEIAAGGLNIVKERRRRENLHQLHDAVMQLREIVDGVAICESLVDSGQVDAALDNIDSLESLIAGEATYGRHPSIQLRDLRGATALQGVSNDLDTLRFQIGKAYESRFLSLLLGDLRRHVEQVSTQEVLMRWSSASSRTRGGHTREPSAFPSYMAATDALRTELLSILTGLHRAKYLAAAAAAYRDAAMREIRNIIRKPLPSSSDDDNESMMSSSTTTGGRQRSQQEKSSVLARNLRALEPKEAEYLLVKVYIGVAETLRRLGTQVKVLLDVASSIGESGPSGMRSPPLRSPPFSPTARHPSTTGLEAQEEIHKALDIANLLGRGVDVAQDRIVKLLRVRSEQSSHLGLVWFLRYFTLNLHFANECEASSGRSGTALKTVVNGHIKEFVQQHGDTEKQKLAQGMESDQWSAQDFGDSDTQLLNQILEGSTRDAAAWTEGAKIWLPHPDEDDDKEPDVDDLGQSNAAAKSKTRCAIIEEEAFLLPNSAVLCMNGMARFLHLVVGIPSVTVDISASLVAFLQLFNSRCTQLILGAGATRSAGLKNITTKHLALASQALAFIAAVIPHVREFVRRHCSSGTNVSSVMGEFDKVRRLYQEHQNSIYDKLVEIMTGRALVGTKKLKALDWESLAASSVHEYMETLAKETTTLHRNLTKHLPEGTVRMIMVPVFRNYKETFGAAFRGLEPGTEVGRDSMLRDVEFFQSRLGKIDGFEDAGDYLLKIIKSKDIRKPSPAPTPAPASAPAATEAAPAPTQTTTSQLAEASPEEADEKKAVEGLSAELQAQTGQGSRENGDASSVH